MAQLGSAPGLGPGGRGFESPFPDHLTFLVISPVPYEAASAFHGYIPVSVV